MRRPSRAGLLDAFDRQRQVDLAARLVARHLTLGHPPQMVIATLARALLREDAVFHAYQMLEAGVRQFNAWGDTDEGRHILIAVARYLAAHSPTASALQTADIARRLMLGSGAPHLRHAAQSFRTGGGFRATDERGPRLVVPSGCAPPYYDGVASEWAELARAIRIFVPTVRRPRLKRWTITALLGQTLETDLSRLASAHAHRFRIWRMNNESD